MSSFVIGYVQVVHACPCAGVGCEDVGRDESLTSGLVEYNSFLISEAAMAEHSR